MFPFVNAITGGGGALVRPRIKSPDYVTGVSGWTINQDGTSEFQDAIIRGSIEVGGSSPNAREVIGGTIPTELVTYYSAGAPEAATPPETVVALIEQAFDGQGNYSYKALVVDSTAPSKLSSIVEGRVISGTVAEYYRVILNPNVGATTAVETAFYNNPVFFESNSVDTDVMAFGLPADAVGRLVLDAGGRLYFGTGPSADTFLGRAGSQQLVADNILANTAGAGAVGVAETWHAVTFQNNWGNGAGTPLQYRKLSSPANAVQIIGSCHSPNPFVASTIFTLPVGYRPGHDQYAVICRDTAVFDRVKFTASTGAVVSSVTTVGVDWFFNCIIQTDI